MIHTLTLNPSIDKTATISEFTLDAVNRISDFRCDPGGKGINVSKVVCELGGQTLAHVLLAGDTGSAIARALDELGVEHKDWKVAGESRTNLKIVDPSLNTHTDINEPGPEVDEAILEELQAGLKALVRANDIIVLAGSLPRGVDKSYYKTLIAELSGVGAKVFLDADGQALAEGIQAKPYLIKPNEIELGDLLGRKLESDEEIVEAARDVLELGLSRIMVSCGGAGAVYVDDKRAIRAVSPKVKVGSTVGAGDSVVAALACAEEAGLSLEDSLKLAMATGSANVMQEGTQAAPRELVESLIDKVELREL